MTILANEIMHLPLDAVRPSPYQPRRIFDQNGLDELAASIKVYGVLQPISVREMRDGIYELVAGERRLRASRLAGLTSVPAILVDISELDSAVIAIIENLQRRDLHFFEEAEGFRNLMNDYAFTQETLAARVGKNQSTIANKLRLLRIPRPLQKKIIEGELTERHARALIRLQNEDAQLAVLEKVITNGLNVQKTEALVDAILTPPLPKNKMSALPFKAQMRDLRILTNSIKADLEIMHRSGMGTHMDVQETETGYNIHITLTRPQNASTSA